MDKYVYNHKERFMLALRKLLQINVGGCFYNLIKSLSFNSTCAIKLPKSKHFPSVMREVFCLQGCILSPLLFNLYINDLGAAFENTLSDPFVLPNGAKLNSFFLCR